MKAWKHHVAKHFINGSNPTHPNGAGKGGTIFLDWSEMVKYLKNDGRDWYVAEIEVEENELLFEFRNDYMATILVNRTSDEGFVPIEL